jgi:hypothetical protein
MNFNTSSLIKWNEMFSNDYNLVKLCFNEELIPEIASALNNTNPNYINYCSDNCFERNQKLKITENKECVDDCKDSIYKFEYDNMCFISCPKGTHSLINNKYLCEKCIPVTFFNKSCKINFNDLYEENEIIN